MKRKNFILAILLTCICCALGLFATGCDKLLGTLQGTEKPVNVSDVEIRYTVNGTETELSWQAVDGAKFSVYRADSRYGEFSLIAENITTGSYTDDYRCGYYKLVARDKDGKKLRTFDVISEEQDLFGPNVYVFSPKDSFATVNEIIEGIFEKQYASEFSQDRYAIFFKPGVYDERITLKTAYYVTYAGLGSSPEDVSVRSLQNLNGANGNALINFWRGVENMTFRNSVVWAVSQGTYMRSVKVNGSLTLHDNGGYASGGFLANSYITQKVASGSQQQWLSRNCSWGSWEGQVWNMCFAGVSNAPTGSYPENKYTVMTTTPIVREKPYLIYDENGYRIAVPGERKNSVGCFWQATGVSTSYIGNESIYFARADKDTSATLNAALSNGKHIVFTPGIYRLDQALIVEKNNTVLLGMGLATLTPTNGNACLQVKNAENATVAGLLFDAGEKKSESLVDIGTPDSDTNGCYLYDCFFRVGGAADNYTGAETCLNVYGDETVCDNLWVWRADHGSGVGWDVNDGDYGIQIYGDNVTAYGLLVEHYKKNNVVWHGEGGNLIFYQSEIAYDVPSQDRWMDGERKGYASFKVADNVKTFTARGLGVYSNFHNGSIVLESALQAPNSSDIAISHIVAVALSKGMMENVINEQGGYIGDDIRTRYVVEYAID